MKMKITSHIKAIMLFCITLLLFNCQNEENSSDPLQDKIQTVSIDEAKNFLKGSKGNPLGKSTNSELEHLDFDKITQEKINGSDQLLTVIPFATNSDVEYSRVLLVKIDNEIKSVVFSMYPDENSVSGSFSGQLFANSLEGNFINGFRAKDGFIVSRFVENESNSTGKSAVRLREVIVQNNYKNTVHALDVFGGSGMYGNGLFGGGIGDMGMGDSYYSWDAGRSDITAPAPEQIIDELTGKAKCIFDRLKSSSAGFESAIKKFDGEFTVSHLKLTINNNLDADVYGITNPPVNYVTEVQFDDTKLKTLSDLGAATVFAHEIIHAEIFRKMLSAAQRGTLNSKTPEEQIALVNSLKNDFPGLYDYYEKRWKPSWNHEMMANHYRSTIADIIQQFDNNRLPRSTYEAVAWLGLGKLDTNVTTIAWDNVSPEQKAEITKLINEHFYKGPTNCN